MRSIKKFEKKINRFPDRKKILTEGDSWFHFPIGKNIVDYITSLSGYNVLRIENSGDELMQIMSGKQKIKLRRLLRDYKFEAILFSAGGNDIIGADMDELIMPGEGTDINVFLAKDRFARKIKLIKIIYQDLISIRDDYSPRSVIVVDCYDYIIPKNAPAKLFYFIPIAGPWIKPMLEGHGCYDLETQKGIVRYMIDGFAKMLQELEDENEGFIFLDTRGVVAEHEWKDEIHPNRMANKRIAKLFIEQIEKLEGN